MAAIGDAIGSICLCVGTVCMMEIVCATILIYTGKTSIKEIAEVFKKKDIWGR